MVKNAWTTIKVNLKSVREFKKKFAVHPRETYNDIIERSILDGALYPPTLGEEDEVEEVIDE